MNFRSGIKTTSLFTIVALFLYEFILHRECNIFRELETSLLSLRWMLLICVAIWGAFFFFLTVSTHDLPLIGLLLIFISTYFIGYTASSWAADAIILLTGVTLGKGMRFALQSEKRKTLGKNEHQLRTFLLGIVGLLTFSSSWHLDATGAYNGPRWMGLWNNPNEYGLLMAAGVVLTAGLLAERLKAKGEMLNEEKLKAEIKRGAETGNLKPETNQNLEPAFTLFRRGKSGKQKLLIGFLLVAAFMMGVGLVMSYSRGAWVGAVVGLIYLAKAYGKFKWRWLLAPVLLAAVVVWFFWNTPQTAPWYFQRLDLSRGSAQHRVAAWRAGFEMMRDHPFGVGWNKTIETYEKKYSPPEGGAGAITTNDYLMLGTQLGIPGLVCFVAYCILCFTNRRLRISRHRPHLTLTLSPPAGSGEGMVTLPVTRHLSPDASLRVACRAGALTMLVAFWFDGGLFKLATAAVFWILLELGTERQTLKTEMLKAETNLSLVTSAATK